MIDFKKSEKSKEHDIVKSVWMACEYICIFLTICALFVGELVLAMTQEIRPLMCGIVCGFLTVITHEVGKAI